MALALSFEITLARISTESNLLFWRQNGPVVEAEKTFRTFADTIPAFIGVFRDSRCLVFNRWAEELMGCGSDELTIRDFTQFIWPDDRHQVRQTLSAISAGSRTSWRQEVRLQPTSEQSRWIDLSLTAFEFEEQSCVLGIGLEITPRRCDELKLQDQRQAAQRVLEVQDIERKLIAYDLHDGLMQTVAGAQLTVESLVEQLRSSCPEAHTQLETLRQSLQSALDEGRRLISDLRPMILDDTGIVDAIKDLIAGLEAAGSLSVSFRHQFSTADLPPLLVGSLYRIVQEGLRNVQRHAQVERAEVRLSDAAGTVTVEIEDQGAGFDPQKTHAGHYGLEGIRERARLFGGRAVVRSAPGQGTLVSVEMPLELPDSSGNDGQAER